MKKNFKGILLIPEYPHIQRAQCTFTIPEIMMKKCWLFFLVALLGLSACHRKACPAFSNGKITGTEGAKGKARSLFPGYMKGHSFFYDLFHKKKVKPKK